MLVQTSQPFHEVTTARNVEQRPIIIIGAGPIGMRLYAQLIRRHPQQPILIMGNENRVPYDRVQLSSMLAGSARFEEISASNWRRKCCSLTLTKPCFYRGRPPTAIIR